jgi:hypothetical protein
MNRTVMVNSMLAAMLAMGAAAWAQAPATQPAAGMDAGNAVVQQQLARPGKVEPFDNATTPSVEKAVTPIPQKSAAFRTDLPPAQTRNQAVAMATTKPTQALERPSTAPDLPRLPALANPSPPDRPMLPAGPRVRVESPANVSWLPLPNVLKLRGESPVRAHEPMLDPTGGESLGPALPVFRAAPTAAIRMAIPDPYENIRDVSLSVQPEDQDSPAANPGLPGRLTLTLEKVPAPATQPAAPPPAPPPPPATQPTTQPTTQPAK